MYITMFLIAPQPTPSSSSPTGFGVPDWTKQVWGEVFEVLWGYVDGNSSGAKVPQLVNDDNRL